MIEQVGRWLAGHTGAASSDELTQRVKAVEARVDGLTERLHQLESTQDDSAAAKRDRGRNDRR